jgi:DNA transposition AAA+ family ATPase
MTAVPFPQRSSGSFADEPPASQPTYSVHAEQVRRRALKHHEDNPSVPQTEVSRHISKSTTTYSLFLSGTYTGDVDKVASAVDRYLSVYDLQHKAGASPVFVETSIAAEIEKALLAGRVTRKVVVISTDSGVGASLALKHHEERNKESTLLVSCSPATNTKWGILGAMLRRLGMDANPRLSLAFDEVVEALRGSGKILIFDESHFLVQEVVDVLRCLHDQTGCALVLVGNESTHQGRFRENPSGTKGMKSVAHMQFKRRIIKALRIKTSDITPKDLVLVVGQLLPPAVVKETIQRLLTEAVTNGGIGRVVAIVQLARGYAHDPAGITTDHVLAALYDAQLSAEVAS